MSDGVLTAENVRKTFGRGEGVDGADLTLREGEILLLVGPNGVGKTVLLSCLAGSLRPSGGTVSLRDAEPSAHAGRHLAFMLQDSVAVETLTGRENVSQLRKLHPQFTDRWEEYVERFEIADALDRRVDGYSGGMRRKLEFALTMSLDVPIYLLDEPTAGVDLTVIQQFHDVVLERNRAGATVLVSSHQPMDADLADRIAFMRDGAIAAVGAPDDLVAALPTVVRVTGTGAVRSAAEFVVDGRLFPLGGEARGFLREGAELADLVAAVGDDAVETLEPTHTDLFNYYVHVRQ